jgi:subtilisin family serine protease
VFAEELADRVNAAAGHGTFITGLLHQHAPNADIRSVRVLRPDNVAYESDVLLALWVLADEVKQYQDSKGQFGRMVDIVSISLGYYDETWLSDKETRLRKALDQLTGLGVVVVASAGNDSSTRAFLPAAISSLPPDGTAVVPANPQEPPLPPPPPVVGVGALNPNSTVSWYSNGGPSASCTAPGTCLISTFPPDIKGSMGAMNIASSVDRESVDQDDYRGGFAMWSGTSFAAPLVAAAVAQKLMHLDTDQSGLRETRQRALDALRALSHAAQQAELAHVQERAAETTKQYNAKSETLTVQLDEEKKAQEQ